MVERTCPPFTMSDCHTLPKFKSLPYVSPPFKEIIGSLMKPGSEIGAAIPQTALALQRPEAALRGDCLTVKYRMLIALDPVSQIGARLRCRIEGHEQFMAGAQLLQVVHPIGDGDLAADAETALRQAIVEMALKALQTELHEQKRFSRPV